MITRLSRKEMSTGQEQIILPKDSDHVYLPGFVPSQGNLIPPVYTYSYVPSYVGQASDQAPQVLNFGTNFPNQWKF